MTPLERAIASVGGVVALASAISEKPSKVSMWKLREAAGTGKVPGDSCPSIERATRAAHASDPAKEIVTCEELRPDVEWDVLRLQCAPLGTDAQHAAAEQGA